MPLLRSKFFGALTPSTSLSVDEAPASSWSGFFSVCLFDPYDHSLSLPWRRKWQPTPVFLLEKSHGQRSLTGYSPWGQRVGHDWANISPPSRHVILILILLDFSIALGIVELSSFLNKNLSLWPPWWHNLQSLFLAPWLSFWFQGSLFFSQPLNTVILSHTITFPDSQVCVC